MSRSSPPEGPDPAVSTDLIEYLIVAVPDLDALSGVAAALSGLAKRGTVRILDLVVVHRDRDSTLRIVDTESVVGLAGLGGAAGGLLGEHDIELAALAVQPDSVGLVVVTEDRWAQPLSTAARGAGGRIVAGDRIPARRVEAMLADRPHEDHTGGPA
jgi:hypothetical protein